MGVYWEIEELSLGTQGLTRTSGEIFAELADDYSTAPEEVDWTAWRKRWGAGVGRVIDNPERLMSTWPAEPFKGSGFDYKWLLSTDSLFRLVDAGGISAQSLRVTQAGNPLPENQLTVDDRLGKPAFGSNLDRVRIAQAVRDRGTLALQGLENHEPHVRRFITDVAVDLGCIVNCTAFYSGGNATGFPPHYDTHHVLLLQVEGRKVWNVAPSSVEHPHIGHAWPDRHARNPRLELVRSSSSWSTFALRPGEHLWIPRGWVHHGVADEGGSLHVTIGMMPLDYAWLFQQMGEDLLEAAEFRTYLSPGWTAGYTVEAQLAEFRQRVQSAVDKINVRSAIVRLKEFVWFAASRQPARSFFPQWQGDVSIDDLDEVYVNQSVVIGWRIVGQVVELHCGDRIGRFPAKLDRLVETLQSDDGGLKTKVLREVAGADFGRCMEFLLRLGVI
ncbi:MAG: JmjC domain-containing protein [Candidatus Dormibacteria bacterium]